MAARPFFIHVSKCAGTALMSEMAREYGADRVFRFGGDIQERLDALRCAGDEERARIRAFGGHVGFGIEPLVGGPLAAFTLLRDPVARIASHYAYVLRNRNQPMQAKMLEGVSSLDEYVVRSSAAPEFNNGAVQYLGGDALAPFRPADEEYLTAALARMADDQILVGLQDRYPESLALFARRFGWRHVGVARANTAPGRSPVAGLAPETVRLIERHNELDRALLDAARVQFANRVAAADGLAREVRRMHWRSRARSSRATVLGATRAVKRRLLR
ncbi:MAG: hypothetical protein FJW95_04380 [Actinobacteria bacterium]|nr:hypothetical protein [Actinomycetota bacterium]